MNIDQYNRVYNYLRKQTIPEDINTNQQKKQFINFCKPFCVKNNYLYKNDRRKQDNLLRVVRTHEVEPILYIMHNDPTSAHFATEIMFNKIRERYFWPQMYETIRTYVKSCDVCQRRGRPHNEQPLHPIEIKGPWYQIGIDFVGPLPMTTSGNKYIIVAMDYFTKWPEAKAVPNATAEQVAIFLYEDIICRHGCPQKILSDRGTHFNNEMIKSLVSKFSMQHLFSTPYHPQTNGLVERFNKTLAESLAKLSNQDNWDKYIAPTLFAYRTSQHSTTKVTPFLLSYGREAVLPIDEEKESSEDPLMDRFKSIVDELPQIRNDTYERVVQQQQKQKEYHDQQITSSTTFSIGDKVLLYDAKKEKQWSGKLEDKWKGPYYIHAVLLNGSYKIRSIKGQVLKTPQNGRLLKLYQDRTSWEPQIVISQ